MLKKAVVHFIFNFCIIFLCLGSPQNIHPGFCRQACTFVVLCITSMINQTVRYDSLLISPVA